MNTSNYQVRHDGGDKNVMPINVQYKDIKARTIKFHNALAFLGLLFKCTKGTHKGRMTRIAD